MANSLLMRARIENILPEPGRSFYVVERRIQRFDAPWHFHPEIELTYIIASRGRRFVGDSIEPFAPGDLVLLGSNLPHFWHNEAPRPGDGAAHSIVVQFRRDFMGAAFLAKPECRRVRQLLDRAGRGLVFPTRRLPETARRLEALSRAQGLPALTLLLEILDALSRVRGRPLATELYAPSVDLAAASRLMRVYDFMLSHYREPVTLAELARAGAMTPAAFSRFFKRSTGRNVSTVLNELRIGHAVRLLQETDLSVTEIALTAGFPTLSNFNRRFRELRSCTPRAFRRAQ